MEAKLQAEIIKWLKSKDAYVIKLRPGPGVPVGAPDILALYRDRWVALEVKASDTAPFRPGQLATLQHLVLYNMFVYVVYPENWLAIQEGLSITFFEKDATIKR